MLENVRTTAALLRTLPAPALTPAARQELTALAAPLLTARREAVGA